MHAPLIKKSEYYRRAFMALFCVVLLTLNIALKTNFAYGQNNNELELKSKIEERSTAIGKIEAEIESYRKELEVIGNQKQSLQNEVRQLDLTGKKLNADITLTETKISRANLKMDQLTSEIGEKNENLEVSRQALAQSIRMINEAQEISMSEMFLSSGSLGQFADKINQLASFENGVKKHIYSLKETRVILEIDHQETEQVKKELTVLRNQLAGQKKVVEHNKSQTNSLLSTTKNNEANYKKILDDRLAMRDAFEKEILEYESQLRLLIDPSTIPEPKNGLLNWPLEKIRITQPFGETDFSRSHSYVYGGKGHNGVDFAAPVGTIIRASASGKVIGTGDTDTVCPRASYGKWVLVEHNFGLSTLYAHLSVISVTEGTNVNTGDVVGFSGNTGYSTGPHLHFTLYASQGVKVDSRKSQVCAGTYIMPLADLRAYLNPMLYLPQLP